MALWCYLLPNWSINNLKVAPGLTGSELDIGNRILAAAKDIYQRGTTYNYMLDPRMTVTADKSTAYPVTIDGQEYKQQVFTVWSETWVYDYDVSVAFSDPSQVPEGTKIVDMDNNEITAVTTEPTGDGYSGQFKILYPLESVAGQTGSVQLSLSAPVAQYAAMYAVCQEKDQYGNLQIISATWTTMCSWTWPPSAITRTTRRTIPRYRPENYQAGGGDGDPPGGRHLLRDRPGRGAHRLFLHQRRG